MVIRKRTIVKHFIMLALAASMLWSCDLTSSSNQNEVEVDKGALSDLMNETDILAGATMEQRKTMYRILKSLEEVADDAYVLESDREKNQALQDTMMVNRITVKLKAIGREIEEAREKAADNVQLLEMLDELKHTVEEREAEVTRLKKVKWVKNKDLEQKHAALKQANIQLQEAKKSLQGTHEQLLQEEQRLASTRYQTWLDAGDKLMKSADEIKLVKKKGKLVKGVRDAKKKILRRAIACYETASSLGATSASQKINQANTKIRQLDGE